MNYNECVEYILNIPKFTKTKSKNNCIKILEKLGNPQDTMKVIHVAGTNGKGSTCAFINSILLQKGLRVGMFTSPHLVKINERVKINGIDITDEDFLEAFNEVKNSIDSVFGNEYVPTFFEYIFLIAMCAFRRAKVVYAILEVGMGGRLDATNMVKAPIVSIITSVSMDHMEILGNTIEEIAMEKAGIIKNNVPVVYYGEDTRVAGVLEEVIKKNDTIGKKITKSDIKVLEKKNKVIDFSITNRYDNHVVLSIPFVTEYQTINATLAISALNIIFGDKLTDLDIKNGLMKTTWSGRMEEILPGIYIDGAHNVEGITAFAQYVNEVSQKRDVFILFSVVKEKEYADMMDLISTIKNCKGYFVAPIGNGRALAVKDMATYLKKHVDVPVYESTSIREAFWMVTSKKKTEDVLFCTGSLYMVGEVKQAIFEHMDTHNGG